MTPDNTDWKALVNCSPAYKRIQSALCEPAGLDVLLEYWDQIDLHGIRQLDAELAGKPADNRFSADLDAMQKELTKLGKEGRGVRDAKYHLLNEACERIALHYLPRELPDAAFRRKVKTVIREVLLWAEEPADERRDGTLYPPDRANTLPPLGLERWRLESVVFAKMAGVSPWAWRMFDERGGDNTGRLVREWGEVMDIALVNLKAQKDIYPEDDPKDDKCVWRAEVRDVEPQGGDDADRELMGFKPPERPSGPSGDSH